MKIHPVDFAAILGFVASGGLAAFSVPLGGLFPQYGPQIVDAVAIATAAASGAVRVFANPTDAPAKSILVGAPVVLPSKSLIPPSPPKAAV